MNEMTVLPQIHLLGGSVFKIQRCFNAEDNSSNSNVKLAGKIPRSLPGLNNKFDDVCVCE